MWVPDVYEGAPTTITAFMSVGPKAAGFAVVLRVFLNPLVAASDVWITVAVIAVITMALGSFVALVQDNIKRLLAYSSIAHAGFALLGVVAGGADGIASVMLYLLIYTFMNIGIFGAVVMMRNGDFSGEAIEDYAGFARSHRGLALMMLLFLFALAGIPPTAGFFAKFYVLVALVEQGFVALAVIAVLLSAVAAYFYIRIVMVMYMREPAGDFDPALTVPVRIALAVAAAGTIGIGLFPAWFLGLAQGRARCFAPPGVLHSDFAGLSSLRSAPQAAWASQAAGERNAAKSLGPWSPRSRPESEGPSRFGCGPSRALGERGDAT